MWISEEIFNDQMRGLLVARGGYTSEKKKEEIKRYWYLQFRDCDEQAFIQVMGKLKFSGKSGDGFPSFRDFREEYNQLIKPQDRLKGREYCGLCNMGRVFYRDLHKKTGEVFDYVADCARCTPKDQGELTKINPHKLHKDRLGGYRTFEALAIDRVPQEIHWPQFLNQRWKEKNHGKEMEKQYFTGLHPINNPDMELEFVRSQSPADGKEIAQRLFGKSDPKAEVQREISLKKDRIGEEFGNVPY